MKHWIRTSAVAALLLGCGTENPSNTNAMDSNYSDTCDANQQVCAIENAILKLTNNFRRAEGLPPLTGNNLISYGARKWSETQADRGALSHDGFPAAREQAIRERFGVAIDVFAENVAYMARPLSDAEDVANTFVLEQWANSAPHRRNMVGQYQELGVGVAIVKGKYYATQIFR
jgi:uncharacterized protein YkwD